MNAQKLIKHWKTQDIETEPGIDIAVLEKYEEKHQLYFPQSVKDYFTSVNGMKHTDDGNWCDDEFIRFNNFEEEIYRKYNPQGYFIFADYSLSAHHYLIKLTSEQQEESAVYVDYTDDLQKVSETFTEFVNEYLNKNLDVLHPEPERTKT